MPINPIVLQRRHAELGRIRLGNQVATNNGGTRPNKLDRFRFTSASEQHIRDLAAIYGGEARAWDNGGKPEWEVYSTAQTIPVIVVKGGLSQWMEYWSKGGCVHRCDGVTDQKTGQPCDLTEQFTTRVRGKDVQINPHTEAKPYTRLSVMLPELAAIGVWRMESHGWNAAAEIPAIAELAQFVGELVPANLHLMERRVVKDGETSRFVVPVLDLRIGSERLREIVAEKSGMALPAGQAPALEQGGAAALPSGSPSAEEVVLPTLADIEAATTVDVVFNIHRFLTAHDAMTPALDQACKARKAALEAGPDEDGAYVAEVVDPEDAAAAADMAWQKVLRVAGAAGLTLEQTNDEFSAWAQGVLPIDGTAEDFDKFADYLANGHDVQASA